MTKELNTYKSDISIREYRYKLYVDPQYGEEQNPASINYAVLSNKWSLEDVSEENTVKIIHEQSGDSISLSFGSFKDKLAFASNIYSSRPLKQVGKGHNLENLANRHLLYPSKKNYEIKPADLLEMIINLLERKNFFKKREYYNSLKKLKTIFRKGLLAN
ncbi:MAG TPA: hypothetical protein VMT35_14105 [Ignavibacteriaceae bacterium]|nr:hypothetical protein [Ignavibacteriaceae bacterium]